MPRSRLVLLAAAAAAACSLLFVLAAHEPLATPTTTAAPSPISSTPVPPAAVQAIADRIAPPYDGVLRVDRKVVVQLRDVERPGSYGIPGVTDDIWAIAAVGEMRQTRGVLPIGNSQCRIWFVNWEGRHVAASGGGLGSCDPNFSAK